MKRNTLYTIAPHAPFLPTLAKAVLSGRLFPDWPRDTPFWLSDITIILPTQTARQALAEAFAAEGAGLLPDLRTFGGEPGEEEPFLPPVDAPALPPAISPLTRRLVLSRLIARWAETAGGREVMATPPNAAEILGLADSLGGLADDMIVEGVPYSVLRDLPMADLAENWRKTLAFLDIALAFWPDWLAERGLVDAATRRNARLDRQAATVGVLYGDRPVIAAGSTGSIPATARLMAAVAGLPRGALVLPGLDTSIRPEGHERLIAPEAAPHGHPQYGLMRLLRALGASVGDVTELAEPETHPRTRLVRHALALPEATAGWPQARAALAPEIERAADGLTVIAARGADEEARAIAVLAREVLDEGRSVGIISPDQTLSRRIAAELMRFEVVVDDAAGVPLFQSEAGRLARLALAVAETHFEPVALMALLSNRAVTLGLGRQGVARISGRLERVLLRGELPPIGLAGLRRGLAARLEGKRLDAETGEAIAGLLDRLEAALGPLCALLQARRWNAGELASALRETLAGLREPIPGEAEPDLPGLPELENWARALAEGVDPGPVLPAEAPHAMLLALMAGVNVPEPGASKHRVYLWGQLEARLQSPDVMILAGLNEDIWPRAADPGPWLSRGMRLAAGLEPPERRQGLAAHDFEMALGNAEAVLSFSERLGAAPALPSRLIQRLEGFLGPAWAKILRERGAMWLDRARALDAIAGDPVPATRPQPRPAAALRPKRLSVTEIERLIRSPYDIHARHVLGLKRLPPLGEVPDARERGALVHEIFARFVNEGGDFSDPRAVETLFALAEAAFSRLDSIGERRDIWLFRFRRAAEQFVAFERAREPDIASRSAEVDGDWLLPSGFRLVGRADRLDQLRDGRHAILDFKTGALPQVGEMTAFLAPQLPLEAAMAAAGAFAGHAPSPPGDLRYLKIGLGPEALVEEHFRIRKDMTLDEAADEAQHRLEAHVEALLMSDRLPLVAGVLPRTGQSFAGDYDHLSRLAEWSAAGGEEGE